MALAAAVNGPVSYTHLFAARIQKYVADLSRKQHYHSLELNDGTVLPGLIGVEALRARVRAFPIPEDLIGRRVLDVGAASGWNAFELSLIHIWATDFSFQFEAEIPKGGQTLEDIGRAHIERVLRETQHNLSRAARILDIDRTTLYNKLRRYGLR